MLWFSSPSALSLKKNKTLCLIYLTSPLLVVSVFSASAVTGRGNSPGTGVGKIIAPDAQTGHCTDLWATFLLLCLCLRLCVCVFVCVCVWFRSTSLHAWFLLSSLHTSTAEHFSLSSWWSFQIKMKLRHTNSGSGEQSVGSLQSAGRAGGLSPLSSRLLSLNPVTTRLLRCRATGHTRFTAQRVNSDLLHLEQQMMSLFSITDCSC